MNTEQDTGTQRKSNTSPPDRTFFDTTYRVKSAEDLLEHMDRGDELPEMKTLLTLRDEYARKRFVKKSQRWGIVRHMLVSPGNASDLSPDELRREVSSVLFDFTRRRPTATYLLSVHTGTGQPHVHVAMTGDRQDVRMDREDLADFRESVHENTVEKDRYRRRKRYQEEFESREPHRFTHDDI